MDGGLFDVSGDACDERISVFKVGVEVRLQDNNTYDLSDDVTGDVTNDVSGELLEEHQ